MSDDITIRTARKNDLETIAHFNIEMAMETEQKKLTPSIVTAGVRNLFEDPSLGFYLVAEYESEIVSSLMITYEWSDWRNAMFWWVQSVYVKPDFPRRGLFAKMYSHVKQMASQKDNVCGLRLYVEHENHIAQKTYKKLGMEKANYKFYEDLFQE